MVNKLKGSDFWDGMPSESKEFHKQLKEFGHDHEKIKEKLLQLKKSSEIYRIKKQDKDELESLYSSLKGAVIRFGDMEPDPKDINELVDKLHTLLDRLCKESKDAVSRHKAKTKGPCAKIVNKLKAKNQELKEKKLVLDNLLIKLEPYKGAEINENPNALKHLPIRVLIAKGSKWDPAKDNINDNVTRGKQEYLDKNLNRVKQKLKEFGFNVDFVKQKKTVNVGDIKKFAKGDIDTIGNTNGSEGIPVMIFTDKVKPESLKTADSYFPGWANPNTNAAGVTNAYYTKIMHNIVNLMGVKDNKKVSSTYVSHPSGEGIFFSEQEKKIFKKNYEKRKEACLDEKKAWEEKVKQAKKVVEDLKDEVDKLEKDLEDCLKKAKQPPTDREKLVLKQPCEGLRYGWPELLRRYGELERQIHIANDELDISKSMLEEIRNVLQLMNECVEIRQEKWQKTGEAESPTGQVRSEQKGEQEPSMYKEPPGAAFSGKRAGQEAKNIFERVKEGISKWFKPDEPAFPTPPTKPEDIIRIDEDLIQAPGTEGGAPIGQQTDRAPEGKSTLPSAMEFINKLSGKAPKEKLVIKPKKGIERIKELVSKPLGPKEGVGIIVITILVLTALYFGGKELVQGIQEAGEPKDESAEILTPEESAIININLGNEPIIDPALCTDTTSVDIDEAMFLGLTYYNSETMKVIPELAKSWEVSSEGLKWTFHMRNDVFWVHYNSTSGEVEQMHPVTSHDVEYGVKRILNPETGSPYAHMLYIIKNAEAVNTGERTDMGSIGVNALDDYTIEFTLEEPAAYFPVITSMWATKPVPREPIDNYGGLWTEPNNIFTNGAYSLQEWVHNDHLILNKNPYYYGAENVSIDTINFFMVNESSEALSMYENGDLDVTNVPCRDVLDGIIASPAEKLATELNFIPSGCTYYYGFNTNKPPVDNALVRQALAHAIDRQALIDDESLGLAGQIPATSFASPDIFGQVADNPSFPAIPFDLQEARDLLAEAGYPGGAGLPKITLMHNTSEGHSKIAQFIGQSWKENLGIEVVVGNQELKVYLDTLLGDDPPQVFVSVWCADYPDQNNQVTEVFHSTKGVNPIKWSNIEFDQLTEDAAAALDPEYRKELYFRAEKILCVDEAGIIPIHYSTRAVLTKPYVERTYSPSGGQHIDKWKVHEH